MKLLSILLILTLSNAWAEEEASRFSYEGSVGGQAKVMNRREDSPDRWPAPENLFLVHGNLNTKTRLEKGKFETSFFYRRTESPLFSTLNFTRELLVFPRDLVSREMVDLNKNESTVDYRSDLLIHRLSFEQEFNKIRFEFGRFFINYGLGEFFNPVNTFNLPNAMFVINDLSQATDGARTTYFYNDNVDFVFYTLGSKDYSDRNHAINPTLFLQTTIRSNDWQYLFVGGLDQEKAKVGGEVSVRLENYLTFAQVFYQSSKAGETSLLDAVLGFDRQIYEPWHARLELAYQELPSGQVFSTRLLPQEFTIALAQEFELHPLVKIKPVLTIDPDSYYTYGIFKVCLSLTQNLEIEAFGLGNLNRNPEEENVRQRLTTRDLGIRGQYYF